MAACLAYIWIVYLGALCEQDGWVRIIHRGDRCDLSLFQLGLRLLAYFLNEDVMIPVAFYITIVLHFSLTGNESKQRLAETDNNLLSCVVQRSQEVYDGGLLSSPDVVSVSGL